MESEHRRHPSFGLQWDFVPGQDLSFARELERRGFSYWSLRLETHLKYGGPLAEFLDERTRYSQVRLFSDYLPVVPRAAWDSVHRLETLAFLERLSPARLTCTGRVPQVPSPTVALENLLEALPERTEVNLFVDDSAEFQLLRDLQEVSATVRADGGGTELDIWSEEERWISEVADLVTELWIDPMRPGFSAISLATRVRELLRNSRGSESLDITFLLPLDIGLMDEAARRAEDVRSLVMSRPLGQS